jgi:hypothetical protein
MFKFQGPFQCGFANSWAKSRGEKWPEIWFAGTRCRCSQSTAQLTPYPPRAIATTLSTGFSDM